jgi:REP element-mobilizing transposase RayT
MARPLRLEFEGAIYHVTSRGNDRSPIFRDDSDRNRFLEVLGEIASVTRWSVHAYCLMGNHYHLLLETPRPNLSSGMQRLNGRYTQWFNRRHRRSGHLLQGRYKAILVERDPHLLELCRYVVLNPVRAGIAASAGSWPWSNYRATAGRAAAPKWLEIDWTRSQFSAVKSRASELYRQFVAEGKGARSPLLEVRHQVYLGGEEFLERVDGRLKGMTIGEDVSMAQRAPAPVSVDAIRTLVSREYGVDPGELSRRRGGEDKMAAIYLARKLSGKTGVEIAREFAVKPARVSNILTEIDGDRRPALVRRIRRMESRI